jgi:hypothetical protein
MNPELSRRVAKIMHTNIVYAMSPKELIAFTKEVGHAKSFDDLSSTSKIKILNAESAQKALRNLNSNEHWKKFVWFDDDVEFDKGK